MDTTSQTTSDKGFHAMNAAKKRMQELILRVALDVPELLEQHLQYIENKKIYDAACERNRREDEARQERNFRQSEARRADALADAKRCAEEEAAA